MQRFLIFLAAGIILGGGGLYLVPKVLNGGGETAAEKFYFPLDSGAEITSMHPNFLTSPDQQYVLSHGNQSGITLHRVGGKSLEKVLTDAEVKNVRLKNKNVSFTEMVAGDPVTKNINLESFAEYLEGKTP